MPNGSGRNPRGARTSGSEEWLRRSCSPWLPPREMVDTELRRLIWTGAPTEALAALKKHLEAAREVDESGSLPVHDAATRKSEALVKALLEAHPDGVKVKTNAGYLPLHVAARNKASEAVVKALLVAAVEEKNNDGELPLQLAVERYRSDRGRAKMKERQKGEGCDLCTCVYVCVCVCDIQIYSCIAGSVLYCIADTK